MILSTNTLTYFIFSTTFGISIIFSTTTFSYNLFFYISKYHWLWNLNNLDNFYYFLNNFLNFDASWSPNKSEEQFSQLFPEQLQSFLITGTSTLLSTIFSTYWQKWTTFLLIFYTYLIDPGKQFVLQSL